MMNPIIFAAAVKWESAALRRLFFPGLGLALCLLLWLAAAPAPALAQGAGNGGMLVIRDAEIEKILKGWAAPLIRAAGMDESAVRIILIESPDVNAFVAGGPNIFIHTGLLIKTDNPGEVVGVIAHELGHIAGGHLIRSRAAMRDASWEAMAGTLLGLGAALATGKGEAAGAIAMGGQSMALRNLLAHSRIQESSADQAALKFMQRAGDNPSGLVSFLEKLGTTDSATQTSDVEYVRTHPLTTNRIDALRGGVAASPDKAKPWPAAWTGQHARMKAKLVGFLLPQQVDWYFSGKDSSIAAAYARTIADWRQSRVEKAMDGINALLKKEPDNPYFHELKGQMLLESGRVRDAAESYRAAVKLSPDAALIRIDLGRALIALADSPGKESADALLGEAIASLTRAGRTETRSALVHRLLATAYGKQGKEPQAKLHLAEEALLQRRTSDARRLAQEAQRGLPSGSPDAQTARDILFALDRAKSESDSKKDPDGGDGERDGQDGDGDSGEFR